MHARELVDVAILLATHSEAIVCGLDQISPFSLQRYWIASRCRFDCWARKLKQLSSQGELDGADARSAVWQLARDHVEEILVSELLTRVWTSVGAAHDRSRGTNDVEPVLRATFMGHLEARNRALNLIVFGRGFTAQESIELNRLRRCVERWTDLLLARVSTSSDVTEFGFDARRIKDFAVDMRRRLRDGTQSRGWQTTIAALRKTLSSDVVRRTTNGELNERIATGVLSCLPENLFDSTGLFKSLWLMRLSQNTSDSQGLVADLLALDEPVADRAQVST